MAPVVKNSPASAGDVRKEFHPWVEKILWRWTWQAIVHRVTDSGTQLKRLSPAQHRPICDHLHPLPAEVFWPLCSKIHDILHMSDI